MNIFMQEFRAAFASMIYWTLSLSVIMLLFMLMYPALSQDIEAFASLMNNFPPELLQALGMSSLDLASILGYYGFAFVYVLLIGSIYAIKLSMSVISEELRSKTADFLLTKPVSRRNVVSAKISSVLILLIIQNLLFIGFSSILTDIFGGGEFDTVALFLINLSLIQVQLFFFASGIFIAAVMKKIRTVLPISLGVVFIFFIIQMINQTINDPKLAYVTPFAYFDVGRIIQDVSYDVRYLIINLIFIVILTGLTFVIYQRKDMPSV